MRPQEELLAEAKPFFDESLIVRAEKRITGANAHDARCWIQKYKIYNGAYGYKHGVCALNAKWYRDVLMAFANGTAPTIKEADDLYWEQLRARLVAEGKIPAKSPLTGQEAP